MEGGRAMTKLIIELTFAAPAVVLLILGLLWVTP